MCLLLCVPKAEISRLEEVMEIHVSQLKTVLTWLSKMKGVHLHSHDLGLWITFKGKHKVSPCQWEEWNRGSLSRRVLRDQEGIKCCWTRTCSDISDILLTTECPCLLILSLLLLSWGTWSSSSSLIYLLPGYSKESDYFNVLWGELAFLVQKFLCLHFLVT